MTFIERQGENFAMKNDRRWEGIVRPYNPKRLTGSGPRSELNTPWPPVAPSDCGNFCRLPDFVRSLGALTGNQAVQQVQAGLKAIYVSGWQVAADANSAGQMYPDQSLYPADSVPALVRAINNALLRADQVCRLGR